MLYEDLRVEYFCSRHLGDLPPIDDLSEFCRQFYFLRRSLVTMDEFSSALHRMNELKAWHTDVQTKGARELKKRWNSAVTSLVENRELAETAGVKLHFCTDLLSIVLRLHDDKENPAS